jgi:hypothetical protein
MAIAEAPMSVRYDKLFPALKSLLPEEELNLLGRAVAFIRRLREIRASAFVWSVVLSRFGSGRPAFEQARQWYFRFTGSEIWPLRERCAALADSDAKSPSARSSLPGYRGDR